MSAPSRIDARFAELRAADRAGFVAFVTAGDPEPAAALDILRGLPGAGADLIEVGMPFTDPMADGPAIQAASLRALRAGATMRGTLDLVRAFRREDEATPLVLMGYFNPIFVYGAEAFARDAAAAGADGLIVVDLPPEEDAELRPHAARAGLRCIRLVTPTTDEQRLPTVLKAAEGFVYYVSITGITGAASANAEAIAPALARLRRHTELPVAVGFGIRTSAQAEAVARIADAAVVGSALVNRIAERVSAAEGRAGLVEHVLSLARELADSVHAARDAAAAAAAPVAPVAANGPAGSRG